MVCTYPLTLQEVITFNSEITLGVALEALNNSFPVFRKTFENKFIKYSTLTIIKSIIETREYSSAYMSIIDKKIKILEPNAILIQKAFKKKLSNKKN